MYNRYCEIGRNCSKEKGNWVGRQEKEKIRENWLKLEQSFVNKEEKRTSEKGRE